MVQQMMIEIMVALCIIVFFAICIRGCIVAVTFGNLFENDIDGNPFRRKCKKCGQIQEIHTIVGSHSSWWEDMVPVTDEKCKCHKYSDYRS